MAVLKELTAKDLMIGDWVMIDDKPMKVNALENDKIVFEHTITKSVKPVIVTIDMLLKNGFHEEIDGALTKYYFYSKENGQLTFYYFYDNDMDHMFRAWSDLNSWVIERTYNTDDFYLHEIQHAAKMCGVLIDFVL